MIRVKATREGLLGKITNNSDKTKSITGKPTSSGYIPDPYVSFVALPSVNAVGKHVRVVNPANEKSCIAEVLDVGPWNEHDDDYVFGVLDLADKKVTRKQRRPQAESDIALGKIQKTNHAGIDLGEKVYRLLGMPDEVEWEFID